MKKVDKWESAYLNNQTYLMYYNRLRNYALNMFEWEGLPDEINKRYMETKLYDLGSIAFFQDENNGGFLTLPYTHTGGLNLYEEIVNFQAYTINGYQKDLNIDNAVIIWNDYARLPIDPVIRMYAKRLYEAERTMDVNLIAQKTPILVLAEDTQRLSLKNAYMQWSGNEPFIFGNKSGFDKEAFTVLQTEAPYVIDKIMQYKRDIWNEAMTFLGIGNAKQDKKERLVADEVAANDEQIESSRYIMLQARQEACEQINSMFGLNISVDFKLNIDAEEVDEDDGLDNPDNEPE